jgi:uncharacterized protein YyaL (SSP411 family)
MPKMAKKTNRNKAPNDLIDESSPYLLQHAYNPVDWYPWSEKALEKARLHDKPIFLSIGYAACHWCHVMEHESFENEDIAAILNEHFVSIKVDREQRPDLDQIYMSATIAINGSGGWPMSVFLTPDLRPFFAGTYFPPEDVYGRPGFKQVITSIAAEYKKNRQNIENYAESLTDALKSSNTPDIAEPIIDSTIIDLAIKQLMQSYDPINGGFGGAPKFPHPTDLSFLMKIFALKKDKNLLNAIEHSLLSMAHGGIYDHIGGGFHRYSVDAQWLVPHFEKMLYDNALLAVAYSDAYQLTHNEYYRKIVIETLDFMICEMQDGEGGFYSSLDADSDGEEGKYYVWTKAEIENLLGENSVHFCSYYNITDDGNFENHTNIPNINRDSDLYRESSGLAIDSFAQAVEKQREILFKERQKRIRPFTDDKILTSWNGLTLSALAKGYKITQDEKYRTAALRTALFNTDRLLKNNRLMHSYRQGMTSEGQFLEDYAYLIRGLLDLYEIVYDYKWIMLAKQLAVDAIALFSDKKYNLYLSPSDQQDHFIRPKDITDGALPAPGSILIHSLIKLADITDNNDFIKDAEKFVTAVSSTMSQIPHGMISAVSAYEYLLSDKIEIVLVGEHNRKPFLDELYNRYLPNAIIFVSDRGEEKISLLEGRQSSGNTIAYICKNVTCNLPAASPVDFRKQLAELLGE